MQSKVAEVHEWNWNCAEGDAPEDAAAWVQSSVVEGELAARGLYLMCQEEPGWFCSEEGLERKAGAVLPRSVEDADESRKSVVGIMALPEWR